MAEQLFVSGFRIVPVVMAVDVEKETSREISLPEEFVARDGLADYVAQSWTPKWQMIKRQFETQQADLERMREIEANPPVQPPRAARRAAKKNPQKVARQKIAAIRSIKDAPEKAAAPVKKAAKKAAPRKRA